MLSMGFVRSRPRVTLSLVWHLLLPLGLLIILCRLVVFPNDFWWHIRVGQIIAQRHTIPRVDEFSFTRAGAPWINQAWLMQLALYVVYRLGGLPLAILAHALIVTSGYMVVFWALRRQYDVRVSVLSVAAGAAAGVYNWSLRPQTISFLLFGLLVALLEAHRRGRTHVLWWMVPLFLLWGNAHGAFTFGLVAFAVYILGYAVERRDSWPALLTAERHVWLPGVLSLLALTVTPWGPLGLFRYVWGFFASKVTLQGNQEFLPLTLRQGDGVLFFLVLSVWLFVLWRSGYRPSWDREMGVLLFVGLSLWSRRAAPWFGFVLIPSLAAALDAWWHPRPVPPGREGLNVVILGLLLLGWVVSLPWLRGRLPAPLAPARLVSETTPVAAMAYLCEHADSTARVYQHQAFGAYQIWACPRLKVFIDTRIELYPPSLWDDYFRLEWARFDWEEIAGRYGITHLFLDLKEQPDLVEGARRSPRWVEVYQDDRAVIFRRK